MSRSIFVSGFGLLIAVAAQAQLVQISELLVNPLGDDNGSEFIELRSAAPNQSLKNLFLVVIDGDSSAPGSVDQVIPLGRWSTGANGLLLIRDSSSVITTPAPETNVVVFDFAPDLENGTNNYVIAGACVAKVGQDLDTNDDGILDVKPWLIVHDALTVTDHGGNNFLYAAQLGGLQMPAPFSFAPDAFARIGDTAYAYDVTLSPEGNVVMDPFKVITQHGDFPTLSLAMSPGVMNPTLSGGGQDAMFYSTTVQNLYKKVTVIRNDAVEHNFNLPKTATFIDIDAQGNHYAYESVDKGVMREWSILQNGMSANEFSTYDTDALKLYGFEGLDAIFYSTVVQGQFTEWTIYRNDAVIRSFTAKSNWSFQGIENGDAYFTTKQLPGNLTQIWTVYKNGDLLRQFSVDVALTFDHIEAGNVYFTDIFPQVGGKIWDVWENDQLIRTFVVPSNATYAKMEEGNVYHTYILPSGFLDNWTVYLNGEAMKAFSSDDAWQFQGLR